MRRAWVGLVAGAAAAALVAGVVVLRRQGGAAAPSRPNLVLITIDTLRADHLGCYGDREARTPAIDRLAADGVRFETASTCVPVTLPSHVSIMTGTYPAYHGVLNNGSYRLGEAATTLAEVLRDHGWRTAAVVGAYPLARRFGLAQGFDQYDDDLPPERERQIGYREKDAAQVSRAGLAFLDTTAGAPFFLWLHYFDPHAPYAPPQPFASEFAGRLYDGEVAFVDAQLAAVLERLRRDDLARSTLVVLMSDHGEGLGEHGEYTHGVFLYESTLRVPLIMAFPGVLPAGSRVAGVARSIDVMPTVLHLLHLEAPPDVQGRSLVPLVGAAPAGAARVALAGTEVPRENYGWSALEAVRDGGLKLIRAPRPELYDLAADPGESRDLSGARPEDMARLAAELDRLDAETARRGAPIGGPEEPDEEAREKLASLGYLSAPGPAARTGPPARTGPAARPDLPARTDLPDPKDRIAVLPILDEARVQYATGRFAESIATFTRALGADPGNLTARLHRGNALLAAGRFREARDDYAAVLEAHPGSVEALENLGSALLGEGRLEDAAGAFTKALEAAPDSARVVTALGTVRARQGRYAEAKDLFEKAIAIDPASQDARERLAALGGAVNGGAVNGTSDAQADVAQARSLYAAGKFEEVVSLARTALAAGRDTPDLRFALASALFRLGRLEPAAAEYRRVLEARPGDARALLGLALVALRGNHAAEATTLLERAVRADPANPDAQRNLAILYDEAGRDGDAITHYRAALALAPGAHEIHFFLGRVCARAGRMEEARAEFRAYLDGGGGEYQEAARAALEGH